MKRVLRKHSLVFHLFLAMPEFLKRLFSCCVNYYFVIAEKSLQNLICLHIHVIHNIFKLNQCVDFAESKRNYIIR